RTQVVKPGTSRGRQQTSTGQIAMTSTSGSASSATPSSVPAAAGASQPGQNRPGLGPRCAALSMTSQASSTGAAVPMWPTEYSAANTPTPGCGASMTAAATAILAA